MTVGFKRLRPNARIPAYAHEGDAGMDLSAAESVTIAPGRRALVKTALAIELPPGYEAQVRPRSGLALKFGISVLNTPGTIDAGYRGEIGVILANFGESDFVVGEGERIAQLVIAPVTRAEVREVAEVSSTERGSGGFGSTGVRA